MFMEILEIDGDSEIEMSTRKTLRTNIKDFALFVWECVPTFLLDTKVGRLRGTSVDSDASHRIRIPCSGSQQQCRPALKRSSRSGRSLRWP